MQIGNMATTTRNYGGHTSEERRQARQERLIEAAICVYGEVGFHNATVKAVCATAGLTERYFYESFANAEALLVAAFETLASRLFARLEGIRATCPGTADDRGRAVLRTYYQTFKDDPLGARLFVVELARYGPAVDDVGNHLLCAFGALLSRTFAPERDDSDPGSALIRVGAVGATLQVLRSWLRSGCERDAESVAEDALKFCRVLAR